MKNLLDPKSNIQAIQEKLERQLASEGMQDELEPESLGNASEELHTAIRHAIQLYYVRRGEVLFGDHIFAQNAILTELRDEYPEITENDVEISDNTMKIVEEEVSKIQREAYSLINANEGMYSRRIQNEVIRGLANNNRHFSKKAIIEIVNSITGN